MTADSERLQPFTLNTLITGASPGVAPMSSLGHFHRRGSGHMLPTLANEQTASFSTPGVLGSVKNLARGHRHLSDETRVHANQLGEVQEHVLNKFKSKNSIICGYKNDSGTFGPGRCSHEALPTPPNSAATVVG